MKDWSQEIDRAKTDVHRSNEELDHALDAFRHKIDGIVYKLKAPARLPQRYPLSTAGGVFAVCALIGFFAGKASSISA